MSTNSVFEYEVKGPYGVFADIVYLRRFVLKRMLLVFSVRVLVLPVIVS